VNARPNGAEATPGPASFAARFPGFSLKPTPVLWAFLAAVPLLGIAALNTGNNAIYLLLSLSMGAFVASGALSRHTLSRVRVCLVVPGEVYAGAPTVLRLEVANQSRWLPAAAVVCRLAGMPGSVFVARVPPRRSVEVALPTVFPRRGRRPLPPVVVEVRLPLNFFVKSVRWPQNGEVLVYPRRVRVGVIRWARMTRRVAVTVRGRGRRGGEVEQLREFHPGDDKRDIHWKQTARQQRFIVMERRELALPSRYLALDRQLARRNDTVNLARFEDLVSEVFSCAFAELRRGRPVGLIVGGSVTPPATGSSHVRRVFEQLALVEPVGPGDDPLPAPLGGDTVYRLAEGR
jgi:uncharacterized protein (DUF58 family)